MKRNNIRLLERLLWERLLWERLQPRLNLALIAAEAAQTEAHLTGAYHG